MISPVSFRTRGGFTLVELLVAMAIFVIMIAFLGQLMSNTSVATNASKGRLDADDQARFALDRIGQDLLKLSKRPDLDYVIDKQAGNDEFYFYCEVPGLSDSGTSAQPSGVSLVGYRINSDNKLERYSLSKTWDNLSFLTYSGNGPTASAGEITKISGSDPNFHVLCDGVFRLEIMFRLRDGTYSLKPALENTSKLLTGIDKVGQRQFEGQRASLCVGLAQGGTEQIWRGLGWKDVSAVIVTIAVIDDQSRKLLGSGALAGVAGQFPDATATDTLPMDVWAPKITPQQMGIPKKAVAGIRVYQRAFYLSTL